MAKNDKRSLFEKLIRSGSDEDIKRAMSIYDEMDIRLAKRYGLLFERGDDETFGAEGFQRQLKHFIPTPHYVPELSVKPVPNSEGALVNNDGNLLLEGDNLHWLTVLQQTHKGKIDVIYADPPYNTGATTWKYNNNYVGKTDKWKHSKWLSIMEKRLRLAKTLLKPTGVICITIDDYEIATLTLLMNEIFGEENWLATNIIRCTPGGSGVSNSNIEHEYALIYGASPEAKLTRWERTEEQMKAYPEQDEVGWFCWNSERHSGTDSLRKDRPKQWFPVYVNTATMDFRIPNMTYDEYKGEYQINDNLLENEIELYPIDTKGQEKRWHHGLSTLMDPEKHSMFRVRVNRNGYSLEYKYRCNEAGALIPTLWIDPKYSSTTNGTNLLTKIFGYPKAFPFPKSLYAVADCLKVGGTHKNSTVLDMYAGSATTAHAVMELNKTDGGHRRWIMLTNNEFDDDDYLVNLGVLPIKPQDDDAENLIEWNRQAGEFRKTEEFKAISDTDEYKAHGICRAITKKRIDAVITGKRVSDGAKWAEPLGGAYDFMTLTLEEPLPISRRLRMMRRSEAVVCLIAIQEQVPLDSKNSASGVTVLESDKKTVVITPRVPGSRQIEAIRSAFGESSKEHVLYAPVDECQSLSIEGWDALANEGVQVKDIDALLLSNDYIQKNA